MILTKHAIQRFDQRGLSLKGAEMILRYGSERYVPGGAIALCITQRDFERIQREHREEEKQLEKLVKKEIVMDGDTVLTGYIRTEKVRK
ncbi:MAG: hypothetical protein WCT23_04280 [Candidatus Neomarinimicrobiota bacterium]|jgi:hypothetical protein